MYPFTLTPKPLNATTFYILLVLAREQYHAYALIGAIRNASLGSVNIQGGALYPLLQKLCDEGLVDMLGEQAAGKSGKARMYYGLAAEGRLRLIEELKRQQHAVRIGEAAGLLFNNETPPDIQRLLDLAKQ